MSRVAMTLSISFALLASAACQGETPPATTQDEAPAASTEREGTAETAAQAAEQQRRERERAAMQDAVDDARKRIDDLETRVDALESNAEPVRNDIDGELRSDLDALSSDLRDAREAVQSFSQTQVDTWKAQRDELQRELDALESRIAKASEWLGGQKEVLAAREAGIEPVTGEVVALDGGNYDAYLVSVVERVQEALRERGYYRGPADGVLGEPTMKAIAEYQRANGLHPSGVPSPMTRRKLLTS